jgi:hypothetical protein
MLLVAIDLKLDTNLSVREMERSERESDIEEAKSFSST